MDKVTAMKRKSNRLDTSRKRIKLPASLVQLMDMNDDCLIHVLQFLDIISLAKMSKADQRFYNLITTYIIPKCTIDVSTFSKHCSVRKIFALFGKSMTSIVMSTDDIQIAVPRHSKFDEMLCMLVKYGEPGSLKYVDLQIGHISGMMWDGHHFCSTQNKLLNEVAPYFANVHTLKLEVAEYSNMAAFNKFVNAIDKQNIRTLHVNNVPFIDTWLSAQSFPSLQSIHLRIAYQNYFDQNRLNATSESRLIHFISCKPASLINFKYIGAWSDAIFVELSRHIPSIERVSQIKYWPNNGAGNNNNNNAGLATLGFHAKWKYFNDFTNLKSVELRSETTDFSDSGEAFSIMAKRNTIEKLELTFGSNETNQGNSVRIADLTRLTKLKTLYLQNFNDLKSKKFANELFAHLPALTTCMINGKRLSQPRVIELIGLARNLKVLKFDGKFSTFSVPFYKKLVKCRELPYGQNYTEKNRLVIHIDRETARDCVKMLGKRYKPSIIMLQFD